MNLSKVYPHALAIATALVGQVVAYVPSWRPQAQAIISAGAIVIAVGMLIYEAVLRRNVLAGATAGGVSVARRDVEAAVRAELARVFAGQATTTTPTQTAAQAPSAAPAAPAAPQTPSSPVQP